MNDLSTAAWELPQANYIGKIQALDQAVFADPFSFLGPHQSDSGELQLRAFIPGAEAVAYLSNDKTAEQLQYQRVGRSALFVLKLHSDQFRSNYQLQISYPGYSSVQRDPYSFVSSLELEAMYLFNQGALEQTYRHLGAHWRQQQGTSGVRFTLWAPSAQSVSVLGDFNSWDQRRHPMRKHPASGVWEIFICDLQERQNYKFSLVTAQGERLEKADPYASVMQPPPATASVICAKNIQQRSEPDIAMRTQRNAVDAPISIYEVHAGSWRRHAQDNSYLSYRELAEQLVPYVVSLGFSHIQLMPINEYPFDGSWGYQPVGMFAPSSRFGSPDDFKYFVDTCHSAKLGLLIDWVPGHFPNDPHGLAKFDGSHLYEHADKRQGYHPDWHTHIYNFARSEVKSFLLSSAFHWFDEYAIDGLRVDAVASMLYLDYSRKAGEWVANERGGRENLAAIDFLQQLNQRCYAKFPGILMAAEESTDWGGVTQFTDRGGLGFGYKWNMGWMNDSLRYMSHDPVHRQYHHDEMTFSLIYAFSENYILPLSHDEVVHGKGSLLSKMPGDEWQKFANLRTFYAYMWAHPGKKLLFMGGEFAQHDEWNHDRSLDWHLVEFAPHRGVQQLISTLNQLYRQQPALHQLDNCSEGFSWIDSGNAEQSIFSFIRYAKDANSHVLVISNMTPNSYRHYLIGVPGNGSYQVLLNTDDSVYAGSNFSEQQLYTTKEQHWQGFCQVIEIQLPPLSTLYLAPVKKPDVL